MMYKKHVLAVVLASAFSTAAHAAILVQSTFDTSAEGWSIADIIAPPTGAVPTVAAMYTVTYSATGGNPGGYISETDPSSNSYYFQAPPKFLGNQIAALNGTLSFDLADSPTTTINPNQSPVILVGTTESIYFPDISSVTPAFSRISLSLRAGGGGLINSQSGAAATTADFTAVLSNLQAVYVLGDYYNGTDTAQLDNVALNSVPEPTTTAAVGLGAMAGAMWFFQRRRRNATGSV